ncbi:MAG: hypothetical protein FD180_3259 [Planctomycetota bacterium]|nr:MAG: hypothetical protein FD180_3259 [Planctomycetota bacterium]
MKRRCEQVAVVVVSLCAAVTLHSVFMSLVELLPGWPWDLRSGNLPRNDRHVDVRIAFPRRQSYEVLPPGPPPRPPAPPPEVSLNDPSKRGAGPLGLRGIRWSDDLGDDGKAFEAALAWLDRHQLTDGGWAADSECTEKKGTPHSTAKSAPGATAIALLAYLGDGITHLSKGAYRDSVSGRTIGRGQVAKNAIKWLISNCPAAGRQPTGWSHQDHALATLALAEAYAMTQSALFRDFAQNLVNSLLARYAWGIRWRNESGAAERDSDATAWALLAIGIAREAKLKVPEDAMSDAVATFIADESLAPLRRASMATAARLLSPRQSVDGDWAAAYRVVQLEADRPERPDLGTLHWVLLAARQASSADTKTWRTWRDAAATRVVEAQRASGCREGSWDPPENDPLGRTGSTAQNALTLLTWKRYAPVKPPK